ncbi:unannotated protein [freshwater metagenome]|uniref:Unannotated protein n=1 Tax=freshwater metagenome TaxID=449393 RepID=A0A6J7SD77_9ZZZZ
MAPSRKIAPNTARTADDPEVSTAEERMASTGLVRPARNAGTMTDRVVTTTPISMQSTTV